MKWKNFGFCFICWEFGLIGWILGNVRWVKLMFWKTSSVVGWLDRMSWDWVRMWKYAWILGILTVWDSWRGVLDGVIFGTHYIRKWLSSKEVACLLGILRVEEWILCILGDFWWVGKCDFRLKMRILSNSVSNSIWVILG